MRCDHDQDSPREPVDASAHGGCAWVPARAHQVLRHHLGRRRRPLRGARLRDASPRHEGARHRVHHGAGALCLHRRALRRPFLCLDLPQKRRHEQRRRRRGALRVGGGMHSTATLPGTEAGDRRRDFLRQPHRLPGAWWRAGIDPSDRAGEPPREAPRRARRRFLGRLPHRRHRTHADDKRLPEALEGGLPGRVPGLAQARGPQVAGALHHQGADGRAAGHDRSEAERIKQLRGDLQPGQARRRVLLRRSRHRAATWGPGHGGGPAAGDRKARGGAR